MKPLLGILLGIICVDLLLFLVHRQQPTPLAARSVAPGRPTLPIAAPLNFPAALDRARNLYGPLHPGVVPSESMPDKEPVIWFAPH